jgi:hypothetical protein
MPRWQRLAPACLSAVVFACGGAQSDAATYRQIVRHANECKRTNPLAGAGSEPLSGDADASLALSDMRACMGLVFRREAVEPLLQCMAGAACDSPCPAPGTLNLAPLASHTAVGATCEQAMRRCSGNIGACQSVVSALLPLTDEVAQDLQLCFQEVCGRVQECVSLLPGVVGGARVADCMMLRARQRAR